MNRWLDETSHKRDHKGDLQRLAWLIDHLPAFIDQISRDSMDEVMRIKESEGCAAATINSYLATVRSILNRAADEWGWLDKAPKLRMRTLNNSVVEWITREEADRLIAQLPPILGDMAEFSLQTGVRQSNCFHLEWSEVDLTAARAWISPDKAKGKKAYLVPLNDTALAIVRRYRERFSSFVFVDGNGTPRNFIDSKTWTRACERAGIRRIRWHDLRHTWATWHAMNGTGISELMKLGGWSDIKMVLRYAHFADAHLEQLAKDRHGEMKPKFRVVA